MVTMGPEMTGVMVVHSKNSQKMGQHSSDTATIDSD